MTKTQSNHSQHEEKTFSQAMTELEQAVSKLKGGQLPIEEALKTFEDGVGLIQFCQKQLTDVKGKVEVLTKNASGELKASSFDDDE